MPIKKIRGLLSLGEIESQVEATTPPEKPEKPKWTRVTLFILAVVVLVLAGINFTKTVKITPVAGLGSVRGKIVNQLQTPVPADIFIINSPFSTTANSSGDFQLSNVPSGSVHLIIGYKGVGKEVPVEIQADRIFSIGQISVEETQLPQNGN